MGKSNGNPTLLGGGCWRKVKVNSIHTKGANYSPRYKDILDVLVRESNISLHMLNGRER